MNLIKTAQPVSRVASMKRISHNIAYISLLVSPWMIFFCANGSFAIQTIAPFMLISIGIYFFSNPCISFGLELKFLVCTFFAFVISTCINAVRYPYAITLYSLIELGYYAVIFLFYCSISQQNFSEKQINNILNSYILSCLATTIIQLNYFNITSDNTKIFFYSFTGVRFDKNAYPSFMAVAPILLLIKTIYTKNTKRRIVFFLLMLYLTYCVTLTVSRGAVIALLAAEIFVLFNRYWLQGSRSLLVKSLVFLTIVVFFTVAVLFVFQYTPDWLIERYFRNSYVDGSNISRVYGWMNAFDGIKKHPIFGLSSDVFYHLKEYRETDFGNTIRISTVTHNTFLDIIINGGLVAGICFCLFLFRIYKNALTKKMRSYFSLLIFLTITAGIIGWSKSFSFWFIIIIIQCIYKSTEYSSITKIKKNI